LHAPHDAPGGGGVDAKLAGQTLDDGVPAGADVGLDGLAARRCALRVLAAVYRRGKRDAEVKIGSEVGILLL
jgi:hypothetical protein